MKQTQGLKVEECYKYSRTEEGTAPGAVNVYKVEAAKLSPDLRSKRPRKIFISINGTRFNGGADYICIVYEASKEKNKATVTLTLCMGFQDLCENIYYDALKMAQVTALTPLKLATVLALLLLLSAPCVSDLASFSRDVPGPFAAKFTRLWYLKNAWRGDFEKVNALHRKYGMSLFRLLPDTEGSVVRIAPNEYSIDGLEAVKVIYGHSSHFVKV